MELRLDTAKDVGIIEALGLKDKGELNGSVLKMPADIADGYMKRIDLGPMMSVIIHQYKLLREITLKIPPDKNKSHWITFSFRNVFPESGLLPCVQVSSAAINLQMFFPAQTKINTLIIHIQRDLLKDLISNGGQDKIIQTIIKANHPFLYEEICSPEILSAAAKIITSEIPIALQQFYLRVRAEELICLFLFTLLKRKERMDYPVNVADLKRIYAMRDILIADLTKSPNLGDLANNAHMSVSKLNRLFKQVFGTTAYNYHQKMRVNKAAELMRNKQYSVTEAGYELGFSNLSYFTRIFEKHIGLKPKKFSAVSTDTLRAARTHPTC